MMSSNHLEKKGASQEVNDLYKDLSSLCDKCYNLILRPNKT